MDSRGISVVTSVDGSSLNWSLAECWEWWALEFMSPVTINVKLAVRTSPYLCKCST